MKHKMFLRNLILLTLALLLLFASPPGLPNIQFPQVITPKLPTLPKALTFNQFNNVTGAIRAWLAKSLPYWHEMQHQILPTVKKILTGPQIVPVYASGIAADTSCTASGASAASINCSLNHAANVLILILATINNTSNNGGDVSSITVGGFTPVHGPPGSLTGSSSTTMVSYFAYTYSPYSANDSVVVNYSGASNNAESMIAVSLTGTRNTYPYVNSGTRGPGSGTSFSDSIAAGETNRMIIQGIFLDSNATITPGGSQVEIKQVNEPTGSSTELNYESTSAAASLTGSWSGGTNFIYFIYAVLPSSNNVVTDSNQANGLSAINEGSISSSTSGTIFAAHPDSYSVCLVGVNVLFNSSSQTVSSVVGGLGPFIKEASVPYGTNDLELWYIYMQTLDIGGGTGDITVTLSAPGTAVMFVVCFANAKGVQLFEGLVTNTGSSTSATSGDVAGNNTSGRRIFGLFGEDAAATPTGSQGVDIYGNNANSVGIDLNYDDTSTTTNMAATTSNVAWAAIGIALLPFPITRDPTPGSSCSATTASATTTTCTISYAANTLITVFAGNAGADTVSSLTVGPQSATLVNTKTQSTVASIGLFYYYATTSGTSVSVTANWSSHNTNEAIEAQSWVGTRTSAPFFNGLVAYGSTGASNDNGSPSLAGEINRILIKGVETAAANNFVPNQTNTRLTFDVIQVSGNSNSMDFEAMQSANASTLESVWGTSAAYANLIVAILPPNQVVVDGNTTTGSPGGTNVSCSNNVASSATVTCALPSHDANVLVIVIVVLANGSSQTVSTVKIGSQTFTQLTTVANGTSVSTDIWWWYDTNSGAETITVTPSGSAAMGVLAVAFANVPITCTSTASTCFDVVNSTNQYVTGTGNSGTASVAEIAGVVNRRMFLAVGEGANDAAITGSQGVDVIKANSATSGLSEDANAFEQASATAYSPAATFTSNNWAAIGTAILCAPPSVTENVTLTISPVGAPNQGNVAISGCSPSPSTIAIDGSSHPITAAPSCSITFTVAADGSNVIDRFSNSGTASTTWAFTTAASGSESKSNTVYHQLQNTYQTSTNGQGPPTWDSTLTAAVTGTYLGSASSTICTISPSSGSTTTASCSGYADYNLAVSEPSTMSGAGSNIRWEIYSTSSWTQTTGGNINTGTYYKQLQNTYAVSATAQSTFDSGLTAPTVTGTIGGTGSSTVCTITINSGDSSDSCSGYADYNLAVTIGNGNLVGAPANSQWAATGTHAWTDTSGGNTRTETYYKQWTNTFSAAANAQSTFDSGLGTLAVTGNSLGSSTTICTITPTSGHSSDTCSGYVDNANTPSVPSTIGSPPTNSQWKCATCNFGSITSGGSTRTVNYYKQWTETWAAAANARSTFDATMTAAVRGMSLGSASSTLCTITTTSGHSTDSCAGYIDNGQAATFDTTMGSPPSNERWQCATCTSSTETSGGNTVTINYYNQLSNTYQASTNGNGPPTWDSSLSIVPTGTSLGSVAQNICTISPSSGTTTTASCTGYADYNTAVTFPSTASGAGSNIRWIITGTSSFTDTTGGNAHTTAYYKQLTNTYTASPSSPSTWDGVYTVTITGTYLGTGSSTICSVNTSNGGGSVSCNGYADYNLQVSFPASLNSGEWVEQGTYQFTDTTGDNLHTVQYKIAAVTQPITCTMDQSYSTTVTLTLTASDSSTPSPSTVNCDGSSHSVTVDASITLTATEPADGSADRQRFSGAATYVTTSTCSSGTCTAWTFTNYDEKENTLAISIGVGTTDSSLTWTFTGYVDSSSSVTVCTISPSSGQTSASNTVCWSNYNRAITAPAEPTGEATNVRFRNVVDSTSTAGTPASGGNTYTVTYDKQLQNTYQASTNGAGPPTWDSGLSIIPTGQYLGSGSHNVCTISPSSGTTTTASCSGWADYNTAVTYPTLASGSGTYIQWKITGTTSFTDTTPSTHTATYYKQLQNTYALSANAQTTFDSGLTAPTVTGTIGGTGSSTVCTITINSGDSSDSCTGYADYNLAVTIGNGNLAGAPANSQWAATGIHSWIDTTGGNTRTETYYKQWTNTYKMQVAGSVSAFTSGSGSGETATILGYLYGSSGQTICSITASSGSSATCTGYSDNAQASALPQYLTGAASNTQWQNSNGASQSSGSITSGANTYTGSYYLQLQNTYQASTNGQGPPTWDSGLSVAVAGTVLGSGSTTVCTISPSSGTTTTASCTGYADYNLAVSEPSTMSGSGSYIQWKIYGTPSWTQTTGGNTNTGTYYKQLQNTYQVTANAQSTFDMGMSWAISGTIGGTGSSTGCTISSTAASTDSCTGYFDYNLAVTIPQAASSPPANSRWQSSAACSFTQTTGGNMNNCSSYKQWTNQFDYSVTGGGSPTAPVIIYTYLGSAGTQTTLTTTLTSVWMDSGSSCSVTNPTTGSTSTERWDTLTSCPTASGGGGSTTFDYYHQYLQTLSYSITGTPAGSGYSAPSYTATQFGTSTPQTLTTSATGYWYDDGASWSVSPNPLSGSSSSEQWYTTSTLSGTISSSTTLNFPYANQYALTMVISPSGGGTTSPTGSVSPGTVTWEDAGATPTISATPSHGYSFVGWTGSGSGSFTGTTNPSSVTMNGAITETADFQSTGPFTQTIALVPGWNLISLAIVPASNSIGNVLAPQITHGSFTAVWSYQGGVWKSATLNPITHKLSGSLTTMQDGYGYWIFMTKADILSVTGMVFTLPPALPSSYKLNAGWNLVGFKPQPIVAPETVGTYLTSISGYYSANNVWVYNNTSGAWTRATSTTTLTPGEAMWIFVTSPSGATLRP